MLLVTLEDDDCANGGAFVFIGALASAIAKVKAQSKPLEVILNVERKLFGLVNGAIQVGALHPHDPETLVPLSKSDYGHGIVAIEELVAWGHSLSVPLDFKVAQNSAAPIAGRATVSDASEHAHESPVRMTEDERQRMDDFFAEGSRRSQRVTEAAAIARVAELARLNARDEYEASKARQQPVPVQESLSPMVGASGGPAKPTATVDRGWVMKKAALIEKHVQQWSTINRDFQDASENGLSKAAKATGHGDWFEAAALDWARQRGKLDEPLQQGITTPATPWTGLTRKQHY